MFDTPTVPKNFKEKASSNRKYRTVNYLASLLDRKEHDHESSPPLPAFSSKGYSKSSKTNEKLPPAVYKPASSIQNIKNKAAIVERYSRDYMRQFTISPYHSSGGKNVPILFSSPAINNKRTMSAPTASNYKKNIHKLKFNTISDCNPPKTAISNILTIEGAEEMNLHHPPTFFRSLNSRGGAQAVLYRPKTHLGIPSSPTSKSRAISPENPGQIGNEHSDSKSSYGIRLTDTIEMLLSVLTDGDSSLDEVEESLDEILNICEHDLSFTHACLYDTGATPILLKVMERSKESLEILYKTSELLNILAENNGLTAFTIYKHDGISTILNAMKTMGKAGIDMKRKVQSGAQGKGSPVQRKSLQERQEYQSNADLLDPFPIINDSARNKSVTSIAKKKENSHYLSNMINIKYGYNFLVEVGKLDKANKSQIIKHLLQLFQKADCLLGLSLNTSLELDSQAACQIIKKKAVSIVKCEALTILLTDDLNYELVIYNDDHSCKKFPLDSGIAGRCAIQNTCLNVTDVYGLDYFKPDVDLHSAVIEEISSLLCIPLTDQHGKVKGVMIAINRLDDHNGSTATFSQDDEFLLQLLARQGGILISNSQIYERMIKTQQKVEVILETTKSLGSTINIEALSKMIMESAKGLLNSDRCNLFLVDNEKHQLRAMIQDSDKTEEIRIDLSAGIPGYVYTTGESVKISDAYSDSRFNPKVDKETGYVTRNILSMPIKNILGKCIGVTQIINKHDGPFENDDEKILSSFSAQAAVAIERAYLFTKTEEKHLHLECILNSITNCVITLSEDFNLMTMNRNWFSDALGLSEDFMRDNNALRWFGEEVNVQLMEDIQNVMKTSTPAYVTNYQLDESSLSENDFPSSGRTINYQIFPLDGSKTQGIVMVLEDISSEKRTIQALGRCMSPALAKRVMEEDESQLSGERKKAAILFSNIQSFDTVSGSMEPSAVVELLNDHFIDAENSILAEQGILDKYIGEAVMAVFGVPFISTDDSVRACRAALRMMESLKLTNQRNSGTNIPVLKMGIGINTGVVLSGNIGSVKRMEFGCIGDAVNLSSRIESLTKHYQVDILISEDTKEDTNGVFWTREIDTIVINDRSNPTVIYELIGCKSPDDGNPYNGDAPDVPILDELSPQIKEVCQHYAKGLEKYREGEFEDAIYEFKAALIYDDGPSETMIKRCQTYALKKPSEEEFKNGVIYFDHK